jgi:hypothetical protein
MKKSSTRKAKGWIFSSVFSNAKTADFVVKGIKKGPSMIALF